MWNLRRVAAAGVSAVLAAGVVAANPAAGAAVGESGAAAAGWAPPATIVGVALKERQHRDRLVFTFDSDTAPTGSASYVPELIQDASGKLIPIAGRALLRVVMQGYGHTEDGVATLPRSRAFDARNVMVIKRAGDFEAVVSVGVGLAKKARVQTRSLSNPGRFVVDVSTRFDTKNRAVTFQNGPNYALGVDPYVQSVRRDVPRGDPAVGILDRIYAGPTDAEKAAGLRLVRSGTKGFSDVKVRNGIARVHLTGRCSSGGSTFTIADQIVPSLRRLRGVDWVKIYDAAGTTESPRGRVDSIPECLEP